MYFNSVSQVSREAHARWEDVVSKSSKSDPTYECASILRSIPLESNIFQDENYEGHSRVICSSVIFLPAEFILLIRINIPLVRAISQSLRSIDENEGVRV